MNICILGDAGSVHLQQLVPRLAAHGHGVHIVTHKPAEVPGATVERFKVPDAGLTNPRRWAGRWAQYLRGFLRRFHVVNVHFLHDWGLTPDVLDAGCLVATPWGSDIVPPPDASVPETLVQYRRMLLRHAACVTTWGPRFAEQVAAFAGLDPSSIALAPLGVDTNLFRPDRPRAHRLARPARVGFFKGFRAVYGAWYLVRAIPRVVHRRPGTRFELVGDGSELASCRRLADALGVSGDITWIARQPHHQLPSRLAGWDLSIVPSLSESFGAAALESSAMRVPIVASNVGGLADTVHHGETGLLVPPADPDALADAILALLADAPRRRRMGDAGRAMVARRYEWDAIVAHWVAAYEHALDHTSVCV